jgi:hypothetical protein
MYKFFGFGIPPLLYGIILADPQFLNLPISMGALNLCRQ